MSTREAGRKSCLCSPNQSQSLSFKTSVAWSLKAQCYICTDKNPFIYCGWGSVSKGIIKTTPFKSCIQWSNAFMPLDGEGVLSWTEGEMIEARHLETCSLDCQIWCTLHATDFFVYLWGAVSLAKQWYTFPFSLWIQVLYSNLNVLKLSVVTYSHKCHPVHRDFIAMGFVYLTFL